MRFDEVAKPKTHMCILKNIPCAKYCESPKNKHECSIIQRDKYLKEKNERNTRILSKS